MKKSQKKNNFMSLLLVIFTYHVARQIRDSPSMPELSAILNSAMRILFSREFYGNLLYTVKIVVTGVAISFLLGTVIAIICSANRRIYSLIMPIVNSTKNIPSIALFPLFIVLLGIGDTPRVFVIIWNSIYPMISSTLAGINSMDKEVIEAAENCGANKYQIYKYILVPLSLINILEGLKISIGNGFIAIVVAEMLGATKGLGYMVLWSANAFRYSEMYVYILIIALVGFFINAVIEKIINVTERKMYYEKGCSKFINHHSSDFFNRRMRSEKRKRRNNEVCRIEGL